MIRDYRCTTIFFIIIFIFSLFISNLFAAQAEFKMIKELEETERTAAPEAIIRPRVEYRAQNLRDPFQPSEREIGHKPKAENSETPEKPLPSLTVQGLIWGGSFPQAIINNKVVKIGDTIQGAGIINIDKDGVIISFEQRQYKLPSPAASVQPSQKP